MRKKAVMQASPEELAAGSAYVSDFFKALDEIDRRITELMLQKYTQAEIAEELGIGQGTVSKHIKNIQQSLLDFDPEIKNILHLFKKTKRI